MVETEIIEKVEILTDIKDPQSFPWPYESESAQEMTCLGVLEYIPGKLRGRFMDEVYRILVPAGKLTVAALYWNNSMAYHDYRLEWPPLSEQSFLMFNKAWRENNQKTTDCICDFDFTYGFSWDGEVALKSTETQTFQSKYYSNSVSAVQLVLTKR